MENLEFYYENGYVSNVFEGNVKLQFVFERKGRYVVFLDTRLSNSLPWQTTGYALKEVGFIDVKSAAEGQECRVRSAIMPQSATVSPLIQQSGSGAPGSVNSETVEDGSLGVADMDDEVKAGLDELNNISLTDEDLEEIFEDGQNGGTQEAGAGEDEVSGGGPSLDDLDDLPDAGHQ